MRVNEAMRPMIFFVWFVFAMLAFIVWVLALVFNGWHTLAFVAFYFCSYKTWRYSQ